MVTAGVSICDAQVGIGTTTPNNSSILEVSSTNRGFLPPRMTEIERNAITNPALGLLIYNSTSKCIETYNGTGGGNNAADWSNLCVGGGSGNSGTGAGVVITPPTNPTGNLTVNTRTCFDIAESNDFDNGCGSLALRTNSKSDFSQQATYEQTVNISTTIAVTDLALVAYNTEGTVIHSITQPALTSLTASGNTSKTTATVTYKQNLNTTALGKSVADALGAEIYLTYKEGGVDKQNKINITVKDCECSSPSSTTGWTSVYTNVKGEVFTAGWSFHGSLGRTPGNTGDFTKITFPNNSTGNQPKIIRTSSGYHHTIALDDQGNVYGFGGGSYGQLGGQTSALANPTPFKITDIPANEKVVQISAGHYISYLLTDNNKIYRTGYGIRGQLGNNSTSNLSTFTYLDLSGTFYTNQNNGVVPIPKYIYATTERAFFIDQNKKLWVTGYKKHGALGIGSSADVRRFTKVVGDINSVTNKRLPQNYQVAQIVATLFNTAIFLTDGTVFIAGQTYNSLIGEVTTSGNITHFEKLKIDGDLDLTSTNIAQIYLANSGSTASRLFILTADNKLFTKGFDIQYSMGLNAPIYNTVFSTFKEVSLANLNGESISTLKTLDYTTGIITTSGKIYLAGTNTYYNLLKNNSVGSDIYKVFTPANKSNAVNNFWLN